MKELIQEHLAQYQQQAVMIQGAVQALQNLAQAIEQAEAAKSEDEANG